MLSLLVLSYLGLPSAILIRIVALFIHVPMSMSPKLRSILLGERADTVIIKNLPTKWFSLDANNPKPCERFLKDAFTLYGTIRKVSSLFL